MRDVQRPLLAASTAYAGVRLPFPHPSLLEAREEGWGWRICLHQPGEPQLSVRLAVLVSPEAVLCPTGERIRFYNPRLDPRSPWRM